MSASDSVSISLIIDVCLIIGVFFLWLSWQRNGQRQQHLEQLLADTAQQLEEAGRHLNQAIQTIEHLKQQEKDHEGKVVASLKPSTIEKGKPGALPTKGNSQASTILRMQREGESAENIAGELGMPLAQVRLMLKLHTASNPP